MNDMFTCVIILSKNLEHNYAEYYQHY